MIVLDRVSKSYSRKGKNGGRFALEDISLHVAPQEFVVLVGSSGAGKSSLLKMITREEKPDSGKIVVGGIDYDDLRRRHVPHLRRKLGVVFQDFKLLPKRTVFENIAFALEIAGEPRGEIWRVVPKVIDLVGLTGKERSFPSQLSGGEQQRVAIARAVVRQPKILIADEPTGNLDPRHSWDIVQLLEKINDFGTTVLLTTHNMEIVSKLRQRVITIEDGKVVGDVSKPEFTVGYKNQGYMGALPGEAVQSMMRQKYRPKFPVAPDDGPTSSVKHIARKVAKRAKNAKEVVASAATRRRRK